MSTARVLFNRLPHIARQIDDNTSTGLESVARLIAVDAKARAPGRARHRIAASITAEKVSEEEWRVAVGSFLGGFHEFGTSKMAAHPYLVPAAEMGRSRLVSTVKFNI